MKRVIEMILLDKNNKPQNTVYYLAAISYGYLQQNGNIGLTDLYKELSQKIVHAKIDFNFFALGIDFLFLLDKINVNERGDLYVFKRASHN